VASFCTAISFFLFFPFLFFFFGLTLSDILESYFSSSIVFHACKFTCLAPAGIIPVQGFIAIERHAPDRLIMPSLPFSPLGALLMLSCKPRSTLPCE